jgi:SAM-dependent methyltransferase
MTHHEVSLDEGGQLKPLDRILQRWRFSKARPFIRTGDRILDIGCGDGEFFRYLGEHLGFGVGLESTLSRPVAGDRYRLIPGRFPDTLVTTERFDVITMLAVLEHLPESTVSEVPDQCRELLRPGGRVVITVPSPAVDTILHVLMKLRLMKGTAVHEHHGFDPATVSPMFLAAEFSPVISKRFQLGLNNLFVFSVRS